MSKSNVIIVCEAGAGQAESANASLIAAGTKLAKILGGRVFALLIGHGVASAASEVSRLGVEVRVADAPQHADHDSATYIHALQGLLTELDAGAVLFAHTYLGIDLAPRLAV